MTKRISIKDALASVSISFAVASHGFAARAEKAQSPVTQFANVCIGMGLAAPNEVHYDGHYKKGVWPQVRLDDWKAACRQYVVIETEREGNGNSAARAHAPLAPINAAADGKIAKLMKNFNFTQPSTP